MSSSPRSANESPVTLARARSGELYAQAGGVRIHSAYDPRREARRFIETQAADPPPSTWVVLGEALGYLTDAIRERSSRARVLQICYHPSLAGRDEAARWTPASIETIETFLNRLLSELEIEGLKVIEWSPSGAAFPREAERAKAALAQVVREISGSVTTTRAFGLRWARNCLANFLALDLLGDLTRAPSEAPPPKAVVIAASGPSLSEALPLLRELRARLLILSLPSSLAALAAAELRPDLLVATDGGSWASFHLAQILRLPPGEPLPIAMPLSAARGAWQAAGPILVLSQGSLFERELLAASGLPALPIASRGTVAAAAVSLALVLTRGPVVLAGLDLCFRDILEHARPHTFDPLWERGQSRLAPAYGALVQRAVDRAPHLGASAEARSSTAFRTYAGWFSGLANDERRLFRLNPSSVALPALTPLDGSGLRRLAGETTPGASRIASRSASVPPFPERASVVDAVLSSLEERLAAGRRTLLALGSSDERSGGELAVDPELGEILYELDTAGLFEAKRAARLDGYDPARRRLLQSIETTESHFRAMRALYLPGSSRG